MSTSTVQASPRTSSSASALLRALGITALTLALIGGCASTSGDARTTTQNLSLSDPVAGLRYAPRYLNTIAPYDFAGGLHVLKEGNIRLGQNDSLVARLVLARGYLHALLYGELAQSAAVLDDIQPTIEVWLGDSPDNLWVVLRALFEDLARDGAGTDLAEVAGAYAELLGLLSTRTMDAAYHARLSALADGPSHVSAEARVAQLLDIDETLQQITAIDANARLDTTLALLGGAVCASPEALPSAWKLPGPAAMERAISMACPITCEPADASPARYEALLMASCGFEALGWPEDVSTDLFNRRLGLMAAIFKRAHDHVERLHTQGAHPLIEAASPEIDRILDRWTRLEGLTSTIGVDRFDDFDDLHLPRVPALDPDALPAPRSSAGTLHYATISGGGDLHVGLNPHLVASETSGLDFAENSNGLTFPGRLIATAESLERALGKGDTDPLADLIASHLRGALDEPDARVSVTLGLEQAPIPVYVAADAPLVAVERAMSALRRAFTSGRHLIVEIALWDDARGEVGFAEAELLEGKSYASSAQWAELPRDLRPLDPIIVLQDDAMVLLTRGESIDKGERFAAGAIAKVFDRIDALGRDSGTPAGAVDVEVTGKKVRVDALAALIAHMHARGRQQKLALLLFSARL